MNPAHTAPPGKLVQVAITRACLDPHHRSVTVAVRYRDGSWEEAVEDGWKIVGGFRDRDVVGWAELVAVDA